MTRAEWFQMQMDIAEKQFLLAQAYHEAVKKEERKLRHDKLTILGLAVVATGTWFFCVCIVASINGL